MRPRLMHAEGVFHPLPPEDDDADPVADLELAVLWEGMARGDPRLLALARTAVLTPLTDPSAIAYRQEVLADCLREPAAVRELYALADAAVTAEQKIVRGSAGRPEGMLNRSLHALGLLCDHLHGLREFAAGHARRFGSAGFAHLFQMIRAELDEGYLRGVEALLRELEFEHGIIATARLGEGNKGVDIRLCAPPGKGRDVPRRLRKSGSTHVVTGEREDDWRALSAFRGRLLEGVAHAVAGSADHVRGFFVALRDELGFYVGCLNLADTLRGLGLPICVPVPHAAGRPLTARGLYEPCLALRLGGPVTGNDVDADGVGLIVVTGVNRGGKSTFLRSVGLAHLMMQCGMFTAAREFAASPAEGVFTHFKREEDRSMSSGRLDEELGRMSAIVDRLRPGSLLLCNESFTSTNEREGTDISHEIIQALTAEGVRVVSVTHLHDLAGRLHTAPPAPSLFLIAAPSPGGGRTFRLTPGSPSPTAHAADLYTRILGPLTDP